MSITAYDFEFENISGVEKIRLDNYRNQPMLIVNTASLCGFTPQYTNLEILWQKYKKSGLIVIAIPSNDFGHQEPGTNKAIAEFCQTNFNISFLITARTKVIGHNAHPFFHWSRQRLGWLSGPKWNFYKYLVNKNGELVNWFAPFTSPTSPKLQNIIEVQLS